MNAGRQRETEVTTVNKRRNNENLASKNTNNPSKATPMPQPIKTTTPAKLVKATTATTPKKFEMLKSQKPEHSTGAKFEMSKATNDYDATKPVTSRKTKEIKKCL